MYNFYNIGVHIEISSNCNSRCLDCGRFIKGTDILNPNLMVGSSGLLSLKAIENIFDDTIAQNIKYVNFTGTYGDAITHPQFFDILHFISGRVERFKDNRISQNINPQVKFMIETNGGLHDSCWWKELANIINLKFSRDSIVIFAIDGIDDYTHQLYRRGVNLNKVLENAKAVISQKANAVWSMISFSHNEHQLELAKKMSTDLGFKAFKLRRSRLRSVASQNITNLGNEFQKRKGISKLDVSYSSDQSKFFKLTENPKSDKFYFENKSVDSYFNSTSIECEWRKTNKVNIDYTSRVWQCCYFSSFYHPTVEYHQLGRLEKIDIIDEIRKFENLKFYEDQYQEDWNLCNKFTLSEILNHRFFDEDLLSSLNKELSDSSTPRIYRCSKHCGEKARVLDLELRKINDRKEKSTH